METQIFYNFKEKKGPKLILPISPEADNDLKTHFTEKRKHINIKRHTLNVKRVN